MSVRRKKTTRPLLRRLRVCGGFGLAAGAFYSLVAVFFYAFPTRHMKRLGLEPTLPDTVAPVVGGLLMGFLVALLWPARARKDTAIAAGIVAGLPFGMAIVISMAGYDALTYGEMTGGALISLVLISLVLGLPLGTFMYEYDR